MTPSQMKKISIGLLLLADAALIAIWAMNGYEDTWFYATLILITIPISLMQFRKKDRN